MFERNARPAFFSETDKGFSTTVCSIQDSLETLQCANVAFLKLQEIDSYAALTASFFEGFLFGSVCEFLKQFNCSPYVLPIAGLFLQGLILLSTSTFQSIGGRLFSQAVLQGLGLTITSPQQAAIFGMVFAQSITHISLLFEKRSLISFKTWGG